MEFLILLVETEPPREKDLPPPPPRLKASMVEAEPAAMVTAPALDARLDAETEAVTVFWMSWSTIAAPPANSPIMDRPPASLSMVELSWAEMRIVPLALS